MKRENTNNKNNIERFPPRVGKIYCELGACFVKNIAERITNKLAIMSLSVSELNYLDGTVGGYVVHQFPTLIYKKTDHVGLVTEYIEDIYIAYNRHCTFSVCKSSTRLIEYFDEIEATYDEDDVYSKLYSHLMVKAAILQGYRCHKKLVEIANQHRSSFYEIF